MATAYWKAVQKCNSDYVNKLFGGLPVNTTTCDEYVPQSNYFLVCY